MSSATIPNLYHERLDPSLGIRIATAAVFSGLLGDLLFNGASVGINAPIWLGTLAFGFLITARRSGVAVSETRLACLVSSVLLSTTLAL